MQFLIISIIHVLYFKVKSILCLWINNPSNYLHMFILFHNEDKIRNEFMQSFISNILLNCKRNCSNVSKLFCQELSSIMLKIVQRTFCIFETKFKRNFCRSLILQIDVNNDPDKISVENVRKI